MFVSHSTSETRFQRNQEGCKTSDDVFAKDESIYTRMLGDGRPLLQIVGLALIFSGCFAIFIAIDRHFLPHDAGFLGFQAHELERFSPGVVDFMFHNRAAWGGALIAMGAIWLWLVAYPLRERPFIARRILLLSGIVGFGSFLAFLGYGYYDSWHGLATIALLPFFFVGMIQSYRVKLPPPAPIPRSALLRGKHAWLLWLYASGLLAGGSAVLLVSITIVYVPQDLAFIALCTTEVDLISKRLTPVIAHDRSSFGGALFTLGLTLVFIFRHLPFTRNLWQTLWISGIAGFSSAIGIHFYIGYTDFIHLAPAYLGALIFVAGMLLNRPSARISG